jgi:type I restriction enzyme S subunit
MKSLVWADLGAQFDGPHATPKRQTSGPYFLNISSLRSGRLDLSLSDHIAPNDFERWTRRVTPMPGDLLFSYETRIGEAALMPEGIEACLGRRMALLRPNPDVIDSRFLLYYYLSPAFQRTIAKHTIHGATVPRLLLSEMPSWPVSIPALAEQRAIAEVLGALDDKIAANAKLATLSDELVRAKFSYVTQTSRQVTTIGDLAEHPRDLVDPRDIEPTARYVGLEHVPRRLMWLNDSGTADSVTSIKAGFQSGDVLFGKLRPYFHKVVSAPSDGICSTDILVLRPRKPDFAGYVLAAASSDATVERCTAASEGTRMPRTSWKDLAAVEVACPGDTAARAFSDEVILIRDRVDAATEESQRLTRMRDALLPLLMSGKVRVNDAERVLAGETEGVV